EFHKIMTAAPAWAEGLPIAAKAHNSERFAKIRPQNAAPDANGNSTPEPEILQSFSQTPPEGEEEVIMETPISDPPSPDKGPDTPHIEDAPPTASGFDADSAQTWSDWFRKKANGRRRTGGYPHGEDEPAGSKQAAEFVYKAADGAEVLKVRKIEIFNSEGVRIEK